MLACFHGARRRSAHRQECHLARPRQPTTVSQGSTPKVARHVNAVDFVGANRVSSLHRICTGQPVPCTTFRVQCSALSHPKGIHQRRDHFRSRSERSRSPTALKSQKSCFIFSSISTSPIKVAPTSQGLHVPASCSVVLLSTYYGASRLPSCL